MNACPDCAGKLETNALRCRCGWSAVDGKAGPRRVVCLLTEMCEGEQYAGIVRGGKIVPACRACYDAYHAEKARSYNASQDADRVKANREGVMKILRMGRI